MIRINLLPFRAARRKENVKRQITLFALTVLLVIAVMGYVFWSFDKTLSGLKTEQANKKQELASYAGINKKIKEMKKKITENRAKLNVIRDLEKKKAGPVLLLNEIAAAVPKDKLWLNSIQEKAGTLTIQGTAMDNETVALFMTNLESSGHINAVDLKSSKLKNLSKFRINVSDFVLICKTYAYKEKPKPAPKKKGKRSRRRKG